MIIKKNLLKSNPYVLSLRSLNEIYGYVGTTDAYDVSNMIGEIPPANKMGLIINFEI